MSMSSRTIKCTINGQEVEVAEGGSIIEAYKFLNQDIAHYCWHPGLSVAGVCRLCMVEIEGQPRLQIACNTEVKEGMVITNQSENVKDTVRWGMDFHLINHPLDCPICDQAGECGLQQQYMKFGQYDPEMAEPKVKKRKVVDLGSKIVLDSERCILCSRCVRFTDEVSKTHELGIFNRGDRSEIGTFEDRPLENDYAMNTVDICPVGALTSKDFRFRQRVWYLKDAETLCSGCSTGCNVRVFYNEEGFFRVQPVYNKDVNGHWMCDKGRDVYKFLNLDVRMQRAQKFHQGVSEEMSAGGAAKEAGVQLRQIVEAHGADSVALVLTGQYTSEEYSDILKFLTEEIQSSNVYHWKNNPKDWEDFDGLLLRGDKNPNTRGLMAALDKVGGGRNWEELSQKIERGEVKFLVVAGPENPGVFTDLGERFQEFSKAECLVWLSAAKANEDFASSPLTWQIPLKAYTEKSGTFVNFEGREQKIKAITTVVAGALTLSDVSQLLAGREVDPLSGWIQEASLKTNHFLHRRDTI